MIKRFGRYAVLPALGLMLFAFGSGAEAAVTTELTLSDGLGNSVTLTGSGVTCTGTCSTTVSSVANGATTWDGALGNFTFNVTTGTSKPVSIFPTLMDLNSINVLSSGTGTITIEWGDTGFNYAGGFVMVAGGTAQNSTVSYQAYVNSSNTLLGTSSLIGTFGPTSGAFSGMVNGLVSSPAAPYSLTEVVTLAFSGAGQDSGNFSLNAVPEPSSIALFGSMLLLTGAALRRRKARG